MCDVTEEWLQCIHEELKAADVPEDARSRVAQWEWKRSHPEESEIQWASAAKIDRWFRNKLNHHAIKIGPEYIGCFFYDHFFWPLVIPIVFGRVKWDPICSIKKLPPRLIDRLEANPPEKSAYVEHYRQCNLYGRRIKKFMHNRRQNRFLANAHHQLLSAVGQLLDSPINPMAVHACRFSVELFMKAYLDMTLGLSDQGARQLGHNLERCLKACERFDSGTLFLGLANRLDILPKHAARYQSPKYPLSRMWECYRLAQEAGSMFCRSFLFDYELRRE